MKKYLLLLWINPVLIFTAHAQITDAEKALREKALDSGYLWKYGGVTILNIAQSSFNNWSAGGLNSFSLNGLFSVYSNYKRGHSSWDNALDLGYGLMKQGTATAFIKTDDKIDLSSKYGHQASTHWYYATLLNFKTQFQPGYSPDLSTKTSDFLAPAYILSAIGFDYKPDNNFSAFLAPLTAKTTIVLNQPLADAGAFGVEPAVYDTVNHTVTPGKKIKNEFGGYVKLSYRNEELFKNVSVFSKIDLFSDYLHHPENIDVNWENLISMKVNKYLAVTISTVLIYDNDIKINIDNNKDGIIDKSGPRIQFKEIVGIGLTYKFDHQKNKPN